MPKMVRIVYTSTQADTKKYITDKNKKMKKNYVTSIWKHDISKMLKFSGLKHEK